MNEAFIFLSKNCWLVHWIVSKSILEVQGPWHQILSPKIWPCLFSWDITCFFFYRGSKFTSLRTVELTELTAMAAAIGLWDLVPIFSTHCGHPNLILTALKSKSDICRGAISCLLQQRYLVPLLLEENAQWLFDFLTDNCSKFDTRILKVCFGYITRIYLVIHYRYMTFHCYATSSKFYIGCLRPRWPGF